MLTFPFVSLDISILSESCRKGRCDDDNDYEVIVASQKDNRKM